MYVLTYLIKPLLLEGHEQIYWGKCVKDMWIYVKLALVIPLIHEMGTG